MRLIRRSEGISEYFDYCQATAPGRSPVILPTRPLGIRRRVATGEPMPIFCLLRALRGGPQWLAATL